MLVNTALIARNCESRRACTSENFFIIILEEVDKGMKVKGIKIWCFSKQLSTIMKSPVTIQNYDSMNSCSKTCLYERWRWGSFAVDAHMPDKNVPMPESFITE